MKLHTRQALLVIAAYTRPTICILLNANMSKLFLASLMHNLDVGKAWFRIYNDETHPKKKLRVRHIETIVTEIQLFPISLSIDRRKAAFFA